jgi:Na+-transporting methylmalonyl-CoA/oxaloacetate decarboxylase gamma subunit
MEALRQTLNIMVVSMATVFGVMALLYVVVRLMVRPEKEAQP